MEVAMTDALREARDDLAFLREVAEDRGPLPSHLGAHLFWPGLLYGLNVIYSWAGLTGFAPWPADWYAWAYMPATIVYIPICLWLTLRSRQQHWGPGARIFAAAWSGVSIMVFTIVGIMIAASIKSGINYAAVWPPIVLALYAGAWLALGIVLRRLWAILVAIGCSLTAILIATLTGAPEAWLVMGIGMLLFMAAPGAVMMRKKTAS
jgi:hypothetical protein